MFKKNHELCQMFLSLQVLLLREVSFIVRQVGLKDPSHLKSLRNSILHIDEIIRSLQKRDLQDHEVHFYQDLYNKILDTHRNE